MDDMSSSRRLLLANIPNIALFAFLAYSSLVSPVPLASSRPSEGSSPGQEGIGKLTEVDSRLWQDPLSVVPVDPSTAGKGDGTNVVRLAHEGIFPATTENAALPGKWQDLTDRDLVLFVMLDGSPYAESKEDRLRTRYAAVTALLRCGYQPAILGNLALAPVSVHPEEPPVLDIQMNPTTATSAPSPAPKSGPPIYTANLVYEKFTPSSLGFSAYDVSHMSTKVKKPYDSIHVFYLDERYVRQLSKDQDVQGVIRDILSGLIHDTCVVRPPVTVIGPTNSDLFLTLCRSLLQTNAASDATAKNQLPYSRLDFYSPQPTVPAEILNKLLHRQSPATWFDPAYAQIPGRCLQSAANDALYFSNIETRIFRTNGDDSQAVANLLGELKLRRISFANPRNPVALITEADGLYGQALLEEFQRQARALAMEERFPQGVSVDGKAPDCAGDGAFSNSTIYPGAIPCNQLYLKARQRYEADLAAYTAKKPASDVPDKFRKLEAALDAKDSPTHADCNSESFAADFDLAAQAQSIARDDPQQVDDKNLLFNLKLIERANELIGQADKLEKAPTPSPSANDENITVTPEQIRKTAYLLMSDCVILAPRDNLRVYTYLRGLDGITPKASANTGNAGQSNDSKDSGGKEKDAAEEPAGPAQTDYVRRLAEKLGQGLLRPDSALYTRNHFSAIGVTGSDVYDKLLIIRALRKDFPSAVFFTIDLEAAYAQPGEMTYTRGLISASRYDLNPGPYPYLSSPESKDDVSKEYGPVLNVPSYPLLFRNGYQTAIFQSCCRAILQADPPGKTTFPLPAPKIFQLGRTGFFPLNFSSTGNAAASTLPNNTADLSRDIDLLATSAICLMALAIIIGIAFWPGNLNQFGYGWIAVAAIMILMWMMAQIATWPNEQPFYLWEGISSWPTTVIRLVALLLSALFFYLVIKSSLDANKTRPWQHLEKSVVDFKSRATYPFRWFQLSEENRKQGLLDYENKRKIGARLWRTVVLLVLFGSYVCVLLSLFDLPIDPTRGVWSHRIYVIALIASVVSSSLLAFYVADALALCRAFLTWTKNRILDTTEALAHLDPFTADHAGNDVVFKKQDAILREMAALADEAADRTKAIEEVIYYPFGCLLFLLLARDGGFERYDWPSILFFGMPAPYLILCILFWSLRREAEKIRKIAVSAIEKAVEECEVKARDVHYLVPVWRRNSMRKIFSIERKILVREKDYFTRLEAGAFSKFSSSPIFASVLVSLGGVSALQGVQFVGHYLGN